MKHLCPQCDVEMKPVQQEYPGEPGLMATVQECEKCGFTYLAHKDEYNLTHKLLFRRNDEIAKLKAEIVILKRRLNST